MTPDPARIRTEEAETHPARKRLVGVLSGD